VPGKAQQLMKAFDVYSYGMASSSTSYTIADAFPAPEGYGLMKAWDDQKKTV
jgi:hypothetical protein